MSELDEYLITTRQFEEFRKIPRLSRECIVTEKIDGTNGQIYIEDDGLGLYVGSKSRWLSAKEDNHGFYAWAMKNLDELLKLGPGRHYGEFWGSGIQRGYGLQKNDKRFSLFNTSRWNTDNVPACCGVVPVLFTGLFDTSIIEATLMLLKASGSRAAPGFMNPEGVVIFHTALNGYFKKTIEKDDEWKGKQQ